MLVLSRKRDEEIVIAGEIVVKIIRVQGEKVRLGISAPETVRIDRGEVAARRSFEEPSTLQNEHLVAAH